ncbi:copper resistance protein B [Sulfuriflexus sp.]|uniref:copper resistance protein B n=1 Tax=Sulfuriflexus sp. TaxID=2015443 RepID=UPI0028CE1DA3|nr:copper resistance protein B [Sulfuriflexus sp.]MDT8403201.1 copper resistance protein B [Sulfuriflexus sp.]
MNSKRMNLIVAAIMTLSVPSVWAEEATKPTMTETEMGAMQGMDHSNMNSDANAMDSMSEMGSSKMNNDARPAEDHSGHDMSGSSEQASQGMKDMRQDDGMESGSMSMSMQGGEAPADARSPDYSDGYDFGSIPRPEFADEHNFASLMVDRFENVKTDKNNSVTYDMQAWFGRDYNRAVLKSEGDYDGGKLQEASTELLWSHAIASYWDVQVGVRYDSSEEVPDRTWLAFGVQGLAPYWFELDATGYVGEEGRVGLAFEGEYELLLTQKLILQPRFEMDLYSRRDAARGLGSGLSEASAGLRLRYEFKRELAPYIGVEWENKFGETKDFARDEGEDTSETRFVAGLRFWF